MWSGGRNISCDSVAESCGSDDHRANRNLDSNCSSCDPDPGAGCSYGNADCLNSNARCSDSYTASANPDRGARFPYADGDTAARAHAGSH